MKKRDPFSGWHCFVSVAQHQSFTRAAIELNQSIASVSLAIRQLEKHLGVTLFHRTTRNLRLTEAGEIMFASTLPALKQIEAAQDEIQELNSEAQGILRITAPEICHRWFIQNWIYQLSNIAPKIVVDIHYDDTFENIVTHSFDAGIRLASAIELDMVGIPIHKNLTSVLVASSGYLKQRGMPDSIASLSNHDCIMLKYGQHQKIDLWQLQDKGKIVTPFLKGRYFFSNIQSTIDAALAGFGIAYILDKSIIQKELDQGQLVSIHPEWGTSHGDILLYYPRGKTSTKLRALLQVIQQTHTQHSNRMQFF